MKTEIRIGAQLNFASSPAALNLLDASLSQAELTLDFSDVTQVDSSAVALLLEWQRRANAAQCQLRLIHLPENLLQLIAVYGLSHFFYHAT
ncbi:STAS domain-containing protein [Deefgea salmonis]|uniref:STAS domain-containing protein n=1 Tax=Deefgea salmonis TaxID=2875502 RepID=A0ABS8BLE6_9NEIS|nr:STAS domain-containing protein [Deefgea salmonis]MCB5196542.1 STAS domain-containing protein [Deefgea salmonis]